MYNASGAAKRFARAWFVWFSGLFFAAAYTPVFSDYRYLAGSYAVLGFGLMAAAWQTEAPRWIARTMIWAIPLITAVALMGGDFRNMLPQLIRDAAGKGAPRDYENIQVAEAMRRVGLKPGDRVAYNWL